MQWRRSIPLVALLVFVSVTPLRVQAQAREPRSWSEAPLPTEALHQVQKSDNLHLLAAYYYGDARQWVRIFQTNRSTIKHRNLLEPGQTLRVILSPGWTPLEPYDQWKSRVDRMIPAVIVPSPETPFQTPGLPERDGRFRLRFRGRKGQVELADVAVQGKLLFRQGAKTREHSFALAGSFETRVNEVTPEGDFDVTLRTIDLVDLRSQGQPVPPNLLDPAVLGLPPKGQGIRVLLDNRLQMIKVLEGNPQFAAGLLDATYPEQGLGIGDGWEMTQTVQTDFAPPLLVKTAFVLKGRERFQGQEVLRVDFQNQGKLNIRERHLAITHQGSGFLFVSRTTGSFLYQEARNVTTINDSAAGVSQTVTTAIKMTNRPGAEKKAAAVDFDGGDSPRP